MDALTTRQRDLLQSLMATSEPVGVAQLAAVMNLTPRQVNYSLKGLRDWLASRHIDLASTPGVGLRLQYSTEQHHSLKKELAESDDYLLVLSVEQRQQLILLALLNATEPLILYQLQRWGSVSRSTVLKDLDVLQHWCTQHSLQLQRRPNYGVWIEATEHLRRQAILTLLIGEGQLGPPLTHMSHTEGLVFLLGQDAQLLPVAQQAQQFVKELNTVSMFEHIAMAEDMLGGRYTDNAVLFLALAFAIQKARVKQGHSMSLSAENKGWLQSLTVWSVAERLAENIQDEHLPFSDEEIAAIATCLLIAARNERWPGDLEINQPFRELVDSLMRIIAELYKRPEMQEDRTLRDGVVIHVVPACLRYRFNMNMPLRRSQAELPAGFEFEQSVARLLVEEIEQLYGFVLPEEEVTNLSLLLRAAHIRERPTRHREVWVVCPSGMATAQLLMARLKTRFPRLGPTKVISLRELVDVSEPQAELIITTVPLPTNVTEIQNVIQVHPLLLPEDIEQITQWLA